jgi:hypothetical protein
MSLMLTPVAVPVSLIGDSRVQAGGDATDSKPDLAWHTSIGQFVYLQSIDEERF